jgi:hypothetical protein
MLSVRFATNNVSRYLIVLSAILFVVSLTRNSFCVPSGCDLWPGWGVLLLGWIEPFSAAQVGPFVAVSWFANPCVVAAWIFAFQSNKGIAVALGAAGLLLGLGFLLGKLVLVSEAGIPYQITGYAAGYWIWITSLAVALVAAILCPSPSRVA